MKIKAAVAPKTGESFRIQEVELEKPRSKEVLVRISGTGLCHTDLVFKDHFPIPLPMVLGHEGAGIVEEVGEGVTCVKPGDPVVISYNSCGMCVNCLSEKPYYCKNFSALNYSGGRADGSMPISKDGAPIYGSFFGQSSFAQFSLTTERNVVKVPEDMPLAILGPLGCGIQTGAGTVINALKGPIGSSLAVFGTGSVGLSSIMAAKAMGCKTIIGVDINPKRLEAALEFGATHVINSEAKNAVDEITSITPFGVDNSVDTSGVPGVYRQAVEVLVENGRCALLGAAVPGTEVTFDMNGLLSGGRGTFGVIEGEAVPQIFIPQLIELYKQGRFPFDKLIKFYDFHDINQAVKDFEKGAVLKPVIRFHD